MLLILTVELDPLTGGEKGHPLYNFCIWGVVNSNSGRSWALQLVLRSTGHAFDLS